MTMISDFITHSPITRFKVNGLHGDRDICIDFSKSVKIVLAENGAGKTNALNLLVALLSGRMSRFAQVNFESLEIRFKDGDSVNLTKPQLIASRVNIDFRGNQRLEQVRTALGDSRFDDLLDFASTIRSTSDLYKFRLFAEADSHFAGATSELIGELVELAAGSARTDEQKAARKELQETIRRNFPFRIIHLPTYRRIEEDLKNLDLDSSLRRPERFQNNERLINFGMNDVDHRIKVLTSEIRDSSIRWYQTISARMLNDLAGEGIASQAESKKHLIRAPDIRLMLGRLSSVVSAPTRDKILQYIESGEIFNIERQTLAYFLGNLLEIYEKTKARDEQIKAFMEVANRYLVDKAFDRSMSGKSIFCHSMESDSSGSSKNTAQSPSFSR